MERASQHRFQVLTKRSERLAELSSELPWPENVWMGVSVESEEHVAEGRTGETFVEEGITPLIRIHHSTDEPDDSYVAIENRGHWFYIDDRDMSSKRTFAVLQVLLSLTESGSAAMAPVLSIGT